MARARRKASASFASQSASKSSDAASSRTSPGSANAVSSRRTSFAPSRRDRFSAAYRSQAGIGRAASRVAATNVPRSLWRAPSISYTGSVRSNVSVPRV